MTIVTAHHRTGRRLREGAATRRLAVWRYGVYWSSAIAGRCAGQPRRSVGAQLLLGLHTAWQDGEVRPTSEPKAKAPRGHRRPMGRRASTLNRIAQAIDSLYQHMNDPLCRYRKN
jgi:hypothetical protein